MKLAILSDSFIHILCSFVFDCVRSCWDWI